MIRPNDKPFEVILRSRLADFEGQIGTLPGIRNPSFRNTFIAQLIESDRRNRFIASISNKNHSPALADPLHANFDPLKAAVIFKQGGSFEEACWLVFLSVHFGKNGSTGWRLSRDVYGALGAGQRWDWNRVSRSPLAFREWLDSSYITLKGGDGIKRHFGNHRKYLSLDAWKPAGTGAAIDSYVEWINENGGHSTLFADAVRSSNNNPRLAFSHLYKQMIQVASFGRTAKFDYLTMLGKLELANIEPDSAYLVGATGPFRGAKLLFDGSINSNSTQKTMDSKIIQLESYLNVGMQSMEDSLCNWQKSPARFIPYRG